MTIQNFDVKINGVAISLKMPNFGPSGSTEPLPGTIWLKAGDTINYVFISSGNCCQGVTTQSGNYFISIIEFNVVP
jgi:hypothetical protein